MDVSDHRRQYEEALEQAARRQAGFRAAMQGPGPGARGERPQTVAAPQEDADLSAAVAVLGNRGADPQLWSEALQVINLNIDRRPDMVDSLLELVGNTSVSADERLTVLNVLQQISFRMVLFPDKRPAYLATLRSIVDDADPKLRRRAIGILAREKDEYVQRRLIDGLEGRDRELVPAAKAIQFLGYDIHAEHFALLRRIVERPPSRAALREAIRLLAADPSARSLLLTIVQDKGGSGDVRRVAAIALQSLAPDQFEAAARPIVLDEDEDEQLRALAVNALAHFGDPATLGQDDELVRRVEELGSESDSPEVREAAAGFLSRYRR